MEAVAEASTIVFDKTGTLTKAQTHRGGGCFFNCENEQRMSCFGSLPVWKSIFLIPWQKQWSMRPKRRIWSHEEMHSKVEYIVAHGISTTIEEKKVIIGSHHFVFEDENCTDSGGHGTEVCRALPEEYSHLYLAIEGRAGRCDLYRRSPASRRPVR